MGHDLVFLVVFLGIFYLLHDQVFIEHGRLFLGHCLRVGRFVDRRASAYGVHIAHTILLDDLLASLFRLCGQGEGHSISKRLPVIAGLLGRRGLLVQLEELELRDFIWSALLRMSLLLVLSPRHDLDKLLGLVFEHGFLAWCVLQCLWS